MFLYKKEMYDKFRFPFPELEKIDTNYSQALQDLFVLAVLDGKHNGTFLEIGADHPTYLNNGMLLEDKFGWDVISIDINPLSQQLFQQHRYSKFILQDATAIDYQKLFEECDFLDQKNKRCDFCQFDIEPMQNTLAALKQVMKSGWEFSIVTYEHDHYSPEVTKEYADGIRQEARNIFQSNGYVLVNGNVENMGNDEFEDWWLCEKHFDKNVIEKFKRENDAPMRAKDYMFDWSK